MIKNYELHLPYFKQGDDLAHCKEHSKNDAEAFLNHAEIMNETADILKILASKAKEHDLKIDTADTHYISVSVDEEIGDILVKDELLYEMFDDEEENHEDDFDEEPTES